MYEEEDDDLPLQYRRLTAHLQTGSADFNRRLAAYLTNQVAMRSAVEQMGQHTYNQQYGQPQTQYNQPRPNMFQPSIQHQSHMPHPGMSGYRQVPYPSPHHPGFRQAHGRAYSTAAVPTTKVATPPTPVSLAMDHRRMSTPAVPQTSIETANIKPDPDYMRQTQSAQMPQGHFNPYWQDMTPFTTSLPPESQQMLAGAPALDSNDHFGTGLMNGADQFVSSSYYPWIHGHDMHHGMKPMPYPQMSAQGMAATLAPAALTAPAEVHEQQQHVPRDGAFVMDPLGLNHLQMPIKDEASPHSMPSGQNTPGESFWANFVQDGTWTDELANGS